MKLKKWPSDPRVRSYTEEEAEMYRQLAKKLTDQDPTLKGSESKWLPRIYKFVATPDQVRVLLELPTPVEEIAQKLGVDRKFVDDTIQDQLEKGVIIPSKREGVWYNMRSYEQFHDSTLPTTKYEHEEWWKDYQDAWGAFADSELDPKFKFTVRDMTTPRVRVLCNYKALDRVPPEDVTVFDNLPDILASIPPIAYEPCSCRRGERTRECHSPENTCILNGRTAEYNIRKGSASEVSVEEALEIDDKGLDWGLVSTVPNLRRPTGVICVCHPCTCCFYFRVAIKYDFNPKNYVKPSRYLPEVDISKCKSCQICVEACPFGAVTMMPYAEEKHSRHPLGSPKWKSATDLDKCMGCGNCAIKCPTGARAMKLAQPLDWIPEAMEV